MFKTVIYFLGIILMSMQVAYAQELNCKVSLLHTRIQNTDPKVFEALERSLNEWINNRKWTNDNYTIQEKIDCNFLLTLTEKMPNNIYKANLNIQSSRPVYNTNYSTSTVNYIDRDLIFRFEESQTLMYDDNRISGSDAMVSNLTAVFAYYIYIILGLDYESFAPMGGSEFFKRAQNIVLNAPEEGKTIKGWKSADGNRNRYWIIDQLLSPRFEDMRKVWYDFHRKGLDVMSQDINEGKKVILETIPKLTQVNNDNPSSILMQFFFNAKSTEYLNVLQLTTVEERKDYVDQLSKLDVPNASKYRSIK
jgi:hypothetical protein